MSTEIHRPASPEAQPRYELAASLQAVVNDSEQRDFSLDIQQDEALSAVGHALMEGISTGYIEMATSTGKTAVEALIAEAAVKNGNRVLILAPKIQIAHQIIGDDPTDPSGLTKFAKLSESTAIKQHFGGEKADTTAPIVVSTYAGFVNDVKNNHRALGEFDVVIADECHRSLGTETSKALTTSFPNAVKIGLSATPDFAVDRKSDQVYDHKIYEFSLIEAIETGRTSPVRALVYETDETIATDQQLGDFTERELAPLIENAQRNGTALELAKSFVREGRQGIISCIPGSNNLHARLMSQLLEQHDIRSAAIGSHLPQEEQSMLLKQFASGEIQVLTNTRMLEEGWDSSRASFGINLAPTTSPVRIVQFIGRLCRRKESGIDAVIIDFIDKTKGYTKNQYTALHALDMEHVDLNRVLGSHNSLARSGNNRPDQIGDLPASVISLLAKSHGKRITDILASSQVNPEFHKWERILQKEFKKDGESATLSDHMVLSDELSRKLEKAYRNFVADNGDEPSIDELIEEMGKLPAYQKALLANYAFQLPLDDILDDLAPSPDDEAQYELEEVLEEAEMNSIKAIMKHELDDDEFNVMAVSTGLIGFKEYQPSIALASLTLDKSLKATTDTARQAASRIRERLDARTPYELRSLGERLNLYATFDVYNPSTVEEGRTAYALFALEKHATMLANGEITPYVRADTNLYAPFNVGTIAAVDKPGTPLKINVVDVVLPVAKELLKDAKRQRLSDESYALRDAVKWLEWVSVEKDTNEQLVTVKAKPLAQSLGNKHITYGFLDRW